MQKTPIFQVYSELLSQRVFYKLLKSIGYYIEPAQFGGQAPV